MKMSKKLVTHISLLFLFLFSVKIHAQQQTNRTIDSLENLLAQSTERDITRVKILNKTFKAQWFFGINL